MKFKTNENNLNNSNNNNQYSTACTSYQSLLDESGCVSPSNTIITRSAARLHANNNSLLTKRSSVGKIVKPIPVRPVSSSSSTHSSSFSSSNQHPSSQNNSLINLLKQDSNFSLIAKYFASFPATRLKTSNNNNNHQESSCASSQSHSQSQSPLIINESKSTPFLPFKKVPNFTNQLSHTQSTLVQNSLNLNTNTNNINNDDACLFIKAFPQTEFKQIDLTNNLCTNFKRMIKLDESEINFQPASPRCLNTPNSLLNENELEHDNSLDHLDTRFGQIQMETRSTRKFLIKHHPYLKYNSQLLAQQQNTLHSGTVQSNRPSINLLKMKNSSSHSKLSNKNKNSKKSKLKLNKLENDLNNNNNNNNNYINDYFINNNQIINSNTDFESDQDLNLDLNLESNLNMSNSKVDLDDFKEEDSSGYYSSYHSVDLISTSGSSGGDNLFTNKTKTEKNNSQHKEQQPPVHIPNHHYPTRYFTNLQSRSNSASISSTNLKQVNAPVTRLRYQQQLAAANNSTDLDLDQIEND